MEGLRLYEAIIGKEETSRLLYSIRILITLLPVLSLLIAMSISCRMLNLDFRRYFAFLVIDLGISSLCLSALFSLLVFGKFLAPFPIIGERFTLSYFFFKLPILYDRVPAYLLVCFLALFAAFYLELVVGTYMTSVLLNLPFRISMAFSTLTIGITVALTYSSLAILSVLVSI